jgi:hypothetical protein
MAESLLENTLTKLYYDLLTRISWSRSMNRGVLDSLAELLLLHHLMDPHRILSN